MLHKLQCRAVIHGPEHEAETSQSTDKEKVIAEILQVNAILVLCGYSYDVMREILTD